MIFNGAPADVAEKYQNKPYGQKIEVDPKNDSLIRIATLGFPSSDGIWVNSTTIGKFAKETATTSPSKKPMTVKTWWDVGEEQLISQLYYPESYMTSLQRRSITPEGNLKLEVVLSKFGGKKCEFSAEFKRAQK
jgi:hypothetical protein